jgi:hypothetical protein
MFLAKIRLIIALWKGGEYTMTALIDSYVALIMAGRRTIDQVQASVKAAVLADLNAIGLDGYGNPL